MFWNCVVFINCKVNFILSLLKIKNVSRLIYNYYVRLYKNNIIIKVVSSLHLKI